MSERFTLLEMIGRGGMGSVWMARDEATGRIVALKLLHAFYADDPDYITRFERELELARRIHSAHVVEVLGYGAREGTPYLALEYVDGPSLRQKLSEHGPYTWPEARALLAQIAAGLADAHAAGVIHRDLKPSNVLLGSDGVAKLADFGIAKGIDLTRVTGTSTLLGTPAYLAPEGPRDERSDLYSLGVMAYELLTGTPPFEGHTYADVLLAHARRKPDLTRLPTEARSIVGRLLAKDPKARPASARELLAALAPPTVPHRSPLPETQAGGPAPADPRQTTLKIRPPIVHPGRVPLHMPRRSTRVLAGLGALGIVGVIAVGALLVSSAGAHATPTGSVIALASPTGTPAAASPTAMPSASPASSPTGWPDGAFTATGSMSAGRSGATATLLHDGRVLVLGGDNGCATGCQSFHSAETYDPKTGKFAIAGVMIAARSKFTATLLPDGRVLVIGGFTCDEIACSFIASAELYDPQTGSFHATGQMAVGRFDATATLLNDGRVLIAGGRENSDGPTAELYDRKAGKFTATGPMGTPRANQTATLLPNGLVLIAGGEVYSSSADLWQPVASAELYDPKTGKFSPTGSMVTARADHTATLLPNGRVLVIGGTGRSSAVASAELYDPSTGEFSPAGSMLMPRSQHTATLLPNGRVLLAGGRESGLGATAEIYDPVTGTFTQTGPMTTSRARHTACLLPDGRVLIAGGDGDSMGQATAELYRP